MELLWRHYPQTLRDRYGIDPQETLPGYMLLEMAGRKRGFLISGGEVNTERMARILLDEYRAGNERVLQYMVGQVMKLSKGKANPQMAIAELKKQLG